jgi:peptidoglycan/xylan/chitin deacetylase (PgdA/CDA1 family)
MKNNIPCLFTNDVETTSIINHQLSDETGLLVLKEGMPRLLDIYEKYGVRATFFYTGYIAKLYPDVVKMAYERGHEIGSHGLSHKTEDAFDLLNFNTQKYHLSESKKIIENIIGEEIISFRAPAARVNNNISKALLETGFKIDSSISSQRLDMFLSFGSLKKLNWLFTPRLPYFVDENNVFKKGNSELLEIPISALFFPYIGTFMRILPQMNRFTRNLLYVESKINNRHFNFLTHPNEFIDEERNQYKIQRRTNNYFSYLLGDLLRHKLKNKNLGVKAIPLLEKELDFFASKQNIEFITCKELYNKLKQF